MLDQAKSTTGVFNFPSLRDRFIGGFGKGLPSASGILLLAFSLVIALGLIHKTHAADSQPSLNSSTLLDSEVIEKIDGLLRNHWKEAGVAPSKPAKEGEWARRVYLDLVGRIPSVDELKEFAEAKPRDRRDELIDRLLSSRYQEERSRWLATEWANLLIGRTGGMNNQSLVHRPGFMRYLRETFDLNRPIDQLMQEMVAATGSVRPEDEDHNGAANYLADKMREQGIEATSKTSQIFLGVSVQCTQCHNHPFNENKQNQFWELNAFFRQARIERIEEEDVNRRYARLTDRNYYGEGRNRPAPLELVSMGADRAESYYELRNGKLKVAYPVFLDGTSLLDVFADREADNGSPSSSLASAEERGNSGRLSEVNRREELADLISNSDEFPRAMVNREWSRYFGYGFTRPVIDMGDHNPPTHPELLDELAEAFVQSGFDLNRLTRWIVMSEAYGLDSRAGRSNEEDDPTLGTPPLFSRFYLRQLSAEQIYESLITATQADKQLSEERRDQARNRWLRQFTTAFGNDENGESTSFNGSIPQALAMMNSELIKQATSVEWKKYEDKSKSEGKSSGFLSSIITDQSLNNADRIERLYLAAVARRPDRTELRVCNQMLTARKGDSSEALRDIWWALLNSNEFILQH